MRRVSVVGCPGSGKTTVAARLAAALGVPCVELDALFYGPGWSARPRDELRASVRERVAADGWVVDGNYGGAVQDLVWARADTVVWLDLPRRVVFPALLWRTLSRGLRRTELWNGNRERPLQVLDPRPEHNIVLWGVTRFAKYRARYELAVDDPGFGHLAFQRLCSRAEVARWLAGVAPSR